MMSDNVSWQTVVIALIAALPGIIAAIAAVGAQRTGTENKAALGKNEQAVADVHQLVNGRMTEVLGKLAAALEEIGQLKGEPPSTVAEAPAVAPPDTFVDTA